MRAPSAVRLVEIGLAITSLLTLTAACTVSVAATIAAAKYILFGHL
jgi:hypothetical protein